VSAPPSSERRYVVLAERLAAQIAEGVYNPGDRMPSVRELATRLGVSASTVKEAYGLLLDRRVVESRPQAGYFVRRPAKLPAPPPMSAPPVRPIAVSTGDIAMAVVHASAEPGVVAFGSAVPCDDFDGTRRVHELLAQKAREWGARGGAYQAPPGYLPLREQLARRALDAGCALGPDEIVVTSGCQEALVLCLRAVAAAGDTVAVESPTYYGTLHAIRALGLRALEIPTHPETGISLEALEMALDEWPVKACVLTPNAMNPLGAVMPDERKATLVELLARHDVPLVEDDIYGDLTYAPSRPKAVKAWDADGRVLLCSSVSKTIAPGLRIGWAAPGRYLAEVKHLKLVTSMATATLPQVAVAAFLANGYERHLRTARGAYRQRRDQLLELVAEHFPPATRVTRPAGGFVAWLELPRQQDSVELYRAALDAGVSVAPGPLFSARERYRNFIRLNYAQAWNGRTLAALATLGRLVRERSV
jgi:DNA-binding transcriptional MocR family regulator